MSTADGLAERLSTEALDRAWRRLGPARGPRPDLEALRRRLVTGRYRPGRPWLRTRRKASGGVRVLRVPLPVDRLVQRAVLDVLPPSVRRVRPQVHGYVPGRSVATAVAQLVATVGEGPWLEVVQIDLADLFDTLDHARLRGVLRRRWSDPLFEHLCLSWARAYGTAGRGVGQGGPLSPLLANLYLDHTLDPGIARAADAGWIRYGDDVTAVTARRGGALALYAALEAAATQAGLQIASHKVALCTARDVGGWRVLGRVMHMVPRRGRWSLAVEPDLGLGCAGGWSASPEDLPWWPKGKVGS